MSINRILSYIVHRLMSNEGLVYVDKQIGELNIVYEERDPLILRVNWKVAVGQVDVVQHGDEEFPQGEFFLNFHIHS